MPQVPIADVVAGEPIAAAWGNDVADRLPLWGVASGTTDATGLVTVTLDTLGQLGSWRVWIQPLTPANFWLARISGAASGNPVQIAVRCRTENAVLASTAVTLQWLALQV